MKGDKQKQINIEFRKESSINLRGETVNRMEERVGFLIFFDGGIDMIDEVKYDTIEQALDGLKEVKFGEFINDLKEFELYLNGRFLSWNEWDYFKSSINILSNW
jgi:hypothetical protein